MQDIAITECRGRPHVMVLPLPGEGHINPMLSFSAHLALCGVTITFVNIEEAQQQHTCRHGHVYSSLSHLDIRFVSIPGCIFPQALPGGIVRMEEFIAVVNGVASQQSLLEQMVVNSRETPQPIICIIADLFLPWTQAMASTLGIQWFLFATSNAMSLCNIFHAVNAASSPEEFASDETAVCGRTVVMGGIEFSLAEFMEAIQNGNLENPACAEFLMETMNAVRKAARVIINTFKELETPSLKAIECETNLCPIGPISMPECLIKNTKTGSFSEHEIDCLEWLDRQHNRSVLYVSFGSVASLTPVQLQELAAGIEESKQPFLWVLRGNKNVLNDEFLTCTRDRGIVVNWAPQVQVLAHPAVGGFVTHCGWNSVIESIQMGIPMLCLPFFADQHINALLVTKVWKLGISLGKGSNGVIIRDNVYSSVMQLMHSVDIAIRSTTFKAAASRALERDGSSYVALESIVNDLVSAAATVTVLG